MSDLLKMDFINSLGQLYLKNSAHGSWWPLHTIDVQTGCLNYDVCGLLDRGHIGDVMAFKDDDGNIYDPDDFYNEEQTK